MNHRIVVSIDRRAWKTVLDGEAQALFTGKHAQQRALASALTLAEALRAPDSPVVVVVVVEPAQRLAS